MRAPVANSKVDAIVQASAIAFADTGYRRTQIADVAARSGVALGTIYRYVASKEQLFALALVHGSGNEIEPWIRDRGWVESLPGCLEQPLLRWFDPIAITRYEINPDLVALLGELYDLTAKQRVAIRMLERSAQEWPELSDFYLQRVRAPAVEILQDVLVILQRQGTVRELVSTQASAYLVMETIAWFAMHRHFSRDTPDISDDVARSVALDHLVSGLIRPRSTHDVAQ